MIRNRSQGDTVTASPVMPVLTSTVWAGSSSCIRMAAVSTGM